MNNQNLWTVVVLAVLVIAVAALFLRPSTPPSNSMYPQPAQLPPVVEKDLETLLAELDEVLKEKAPSVARSLQPGLNDQEITDLEEQYGFPLTGELRTLYKWHNGMSSDGADFIPGHHFWSLDRVLQEHALFQAQLKEQTALQRFVSDALISHTESWLAVFPDGAGDGYFYDPQRQSAGCEIFYTFTEVGYFKFFPSLKNLIAGILECYRSDIYSAAGNGTHLNENYGRSSAIWKKYAAEIAH